MPCSPDDTPWEGGTFNLVIEFSEDYPNKPPRVQFVSKLFHPNGLYSLRPAVAAAAPRETQAADSPAPTALPPRLQCTPTARFV